jgi:glucoamylase
MRRRNAIGAGSLVAFLAALTFTVGAAGAPSSAPDGPGAQSYLDLARKDCFGTARDRTSKVWYSIADGVLSDTFSPTIENSNVGTLQYVVTDGRKFADLQQRDMTYTVSSPDRSGMVCRVTSTDAAHQFRLVTDYLTDPARSSVIVHTALGATPRPIGPRACRCWPPPRRSTRQTRRSARRCKWPRFAARPKLSGDSGRPRPERWRSAI